MNFPVKRLDSSDIDAFKKLLTLFTAVFEGTKTEIDSRNLPDDAYLQKLLETREFYALGAFDGTEPVGGVTGYEFSLPNKKEKELYLYDLAVSREHRREGIATALVHELNIQAKENGIKTIFVEAESADEEAVHFYRSLAVEELEVKHFNIVIDEHL
jgi:aminoglycoside 3-N-acetyltransferase I